MSKHQVSDLEACAEQAVIGRAERERQKALFQRRLKADQDLTFGQIRQRFGLTTDIARQWAAEAGLTIGRDVEGLYSSGEPGKRRMGSGGAR